MSQHSTATSQKPSDGKNHGPESTENSLISELLATVQLRKENVHVVSSSHSIPFLSDETRFFVEHSEYDLVDYTPIKAISTIENVVETPQMGSHFRRGHNSTSENCSYEKEARVVLLSCSPLDDIKIFVETFAGEILNFEINPGETINNLKSKIRNKISIPCKQQRLIIDGFELLDCQTLAECGIRSGSTLCLFMHLTENIKIFAKTLTGRTITLYAEPTYTIRNLKLLIQGKDGMGVDTQRLIFNGEELEDDMTLSDHNILQNATVHVVLNLRGGGSPIFVKTLAGKCTNLEVEPSDTIKAVKSQIQDIEGIHPDEQLLLHDGKILEDDKSLSNYNIVLGSMIILVMRSRCNIDVVKVFIDGVAGKIITLHCTVTDTIEEIKEYIQKYQDNAPKERQRLFYKGKELEDENSCTFYNIVSNSTIILQIRPPNGMQIKVNMPNTTTDRPFRLEVLHDETITDIKGKIAPLLAHSQENIFISFEGKLIRDEFKSLRDYNIHHNSTLCAVYSFHYEIKIQVMKSFGPEQHEMIVKVKPNDTVKKLKWKIHNSEDIPPVQQLLIFEGQKLNDDSTLHECGIDENSCVYACKSTGNKTTYVVNCSINGEDHCFEVSGAMTIESILTTIQAKSDDSFYSSPYIKLGVKHL